MLVMTKKKSSLSDSVDYQNAVPKMKLLSVLHACSGSMFYDVRVCYRLMAVVVKAMQTASRHNILL